jgi:hypothetical protein
LANRVFNVVLVLFGDHRVESICGGKTISAWDGRSITIEIEKELGLVLGGIK